MKKKRIFAGNLTISNDTAVPLFLMAVTWVTLLIAFSRFEPAPYYLETVTLVKKLIYFILAIPTAVYLFFFLRNFQFATMDHKGIRFRNAYGKLGFVSWESIEKVELRHIMVYHLSGSKYKGITKVKRPYYSIVNSDYHVLPYLRINPPYGGITRTIPYRSSIFEQYLKYYRPDLTIIIYE